MQTPHTQDGAGNLHPNTPFCLQKGKSFDKTQLSSHKDVSYKDVDPKIVGRICGHHMSLLRLNVLL